MVTGIAGPNEIPEKDKPDSGAVVKTILVPETE